MDDNSDMTIGIDGAMKEGGVKVDVKTSSGVPSEPKINKLTPPPEESNQEPEDVATAEVTQPEGSDIQLKIEPDEQEDALDSVQQAPDEEVAEESTPQESTPEEFKPITNLNSVDMSDKQKDEKADKPPKSKENNRNNKKLAAIVTVAVAVILAGAAVFVYSSAQNNTQEAENDASTSPAPAEAAIIPTVNDVDITTQNLDEAIQAIDESELSQDSLSDEALGL